MKGLVFLMLIFTVQVSTAKSTPPVFHAHDVRIHQHSLPIQGVGHRHGNGALGVLARSTNNAPSNIDTAAGAISSTVIYDATTKTIKPKATITSDVTNTRQTHLKNRIINYVKGDTQCQRGAADCNVCATNVPMQLIVRHFYYCPKIYLLFYDATHNLLDKD